MDRNMSYQDIVEVLKALPPAQVVEVYDFARFLHPQHEVSNDRAAFLATFGTWEDERSDEDMIAEIYGSRATSEDERSR